ncbi:MULTISPECIES: hypothetical protein [Acinetobacter]|uniref:Hint domain-containing protein n=1 Tax=Acinetobacter entericus TaxID=2989714 RepID=A0ABT3NFB1_9GAMM|nr:MULTISPECIES: hypothetical protein [Acinetobacter]MCW8038203.1 Hint domain-containing protein [Acinetobacter entericus]TCB75246.1 hypothetical protein E0H91_06300 [Acinetobacter sp. ANC 4177]
MVGFVSGTLVHTDKGLVPIQEVKVGDLVCVKSTSDELIGARVKGIIVNQEQEIWALTYFNPIPVNGFFNRAIVLVASDQQVWVSEYEDDVGEVNAINGWVRVDELYQCEAKGLLENQQVIGLVANPILATPSLSLGYTVEEFEWNPEYLCTVNSGQTALFGIKHLTGGLASRYDVEKEIVPYNKEVIKIAQLDDVPVAEFLAYYQNAQLKGYEHKFKHSTYQLQLDQHQYYFVQKKGILVHQ